jgi:hypothetical protein
VVVNSSFYDFRKKFKGFFPNQKFVLFYKQCRPNSASEYPEKYDFKVEVGEQLPFTIDGGYDFSFTHGGPFLSFDSSDAESYPFGGNMDYADYEYIVASIPESYNLTEEEYSHLKV